jgi:hypothetical protein
MAALLAGGQTVRFNPPPVHLTRELGWALARAFGPFDAAAPAPVDGARAFQVARLHQLAARIGGRFSPAALAAEVGGEAAGDFRRLYVATAERAIVLAALARLVGEAAAAISEPVVLLKGAALHAAGIVPPGWRAAVDVDVLASRRGASALHAELRRRELVPLAIADCEHHLQPLRHSCGRCVEVHPSLHGVGIDRDVDAEALVRLGRASPAAGWGGALVPDREVLAAHLLIHAIALHGDRPRDYPLARLAADLVDLYPDADGWAAFDESGAPLVARHLDRDECAAAAALALALRSGRVPVGPAWDVETGAAAVTEGAPGAETLLRHLLSGGSDRRYAASLRLASFLRRPGDGPAPLALVRRAWRTVILSRAQIDEIYGAPRSGFGYWALRLWRPFDLVGRLAGSLAARRRLRHP